MNFIDKTGHIFSCPSYSTNPVGYEYEDPNYVFWIDSEVTGRLSVNSYYIKPIIIYAKDAHGGESFRQLDHIESIKVNGSNVFKLVSPKHIQSQIAKHGRIDIADSDNAIKSELTKDDLILVEDNKGSEASTRVDVAIPFYVIALSDIPKTIITDITIHAVYKVDNYGNTEDEYTPISVGGNFYDNSEELLINGTNIGFKLPKEFIRSIYQHPYFSNDIDITLYDMKLKEYLLNFMSLRSERGNLSSAMNALKWFGWNDKLQIYRLSKIDNNYIDQFERDAIDNFSDNIEAFSNFHSTALLSLSANINQETDEYNEMNFNDDFFGEGHPVMEDLFNKLVETTYDDTTGITYYKSWYDFAFEEMALKLAVLTEAYKKMFLPMHSFVHSSSFTHHAFMNDIKYTLRPFTKINAGVSLIEDPDIDVIFPEYDIIYAGTHTHYIDSNMNEFSNYKDIYESDEYQKIPDDDPGKIIGMFEQIGLDIPIKFVEKDDKSYINCVFVLTNDENGDIVWETSFSFTQEEGEYSTFAIMPSLMSMKSNRNLNLAYFIDKSFTLNVCANGKWFTYSFTARMPEFNLNIGKLEYEYNYETDRQLKRYGSERTSMEFNANMLHTGLVDVSNIRFYTDLLHAEMIDPLSRASINFLKKYRENPYITDSKKYYNRVHYYKIVKEVREDDAIKYEPLYYNGETADSGVENPDFNGFEYYNEIFNDDGTVKNEYIRGKLENKDAKLHYDIYLMHDDSPGTGYISKPTWYVVLISRETLDKKITETDDDAPDLSILSLFGGYHLLHEHSDDRFLINRMKLVGLRPGMTFKTDDIICGELSTDVPFIMSNGTKWDIIPFSIGMGKESHVQSNTNTFLMSIGKGNNGYTTGYYDIVVSYSIDAFVQHRKKLKTRILVAK